MDERRSIENEMADLLDAMYDLGKVAGTKEEKIESKADVDEAYDRGVDEGYSLAKEEFHAPDL